MTVWLQISAGTGPAECALAVVGVAERLRAEADSYGLAPRVLDTVPGPQPGTASSILLELDGEVPAGWLDSWVGTVRWVATSPLRPHHKRRNWFVSVRAFAPVAEAAYPPGALAFEVMRAGGPGGQHQNKTESAVRVTHRPTGLSAIAREGRSQHRNRQLALARLEAALAALADAAAAEAVSARHRQHHELERGNAVRVYEGDTWRRRA